MRCLSNLGQWNGVKADNNATILLGRSNDLYSLVIKYFLRIWGLGYYGDELQVMSCSLHVIMLTAPVPGVWRHGPTLQSMSLTQGCWGSFLRCVCWFCCWLAVETVGQNIHRSSDPQTSSSDINGPVLPTHRINKEYDFFFCLKSWIYHLCNTKQIPFLSGQSCSLQNYIYKATKLSLVRSTLHSSNFVKWWKLPTHPWGLKYVLGLTSSFLSNFCLFCVLQHCPAWLFDLLNLYLCITLRARKLIPNSRLFRPTHPSSLTV